MTFSSTVAQHREKQAKTLRRFIMVSLAGSVLLHSGGLFLKIRDLWNPEESVSEDIIIVVTEPEDETTVEPDVPLDEPVATSEFTSPTVEPFNDPTVIEESVAPEPPIDEPLPETIPEEDAMPEEVALADPPSDQPSEFNTRTLDNLLSELRQARQNPPQRPTGSPNASGPPGDPVPGPGGVAGNGTTAAAASGSGPVPPTPNSTGGRQSREISCRGCDFDYPTSADGAEGTAQVIVETNDQGQVVSVLLSRSSGNAELDRSALEQARRRVRLTNARSGESYPIDIDFVQPNSQAAQRVRERGDRRTITVSDPEPETAEVTPTLPATETPENASSDLQPEPSAPVQPSPSPAPEASTSPAPEGQPSQPSTSPSPAPAAPPSPSPAPEPPADPTPPVQPAAPPNPEPVNRAEPAPEPEPSL